MSVSVYSSIVSTSIFYPCGISPKNVFEIETDDGSLLCGYNPNKDCPKNIVFFPGNAESVSDYEVHLQRAFEIAGYNTFVVGYRGYGGSFGSPSLGTLVKDCHFIAEQLPFDLQDSVCFGRSLGSIPAIAMTSGKVKPNGLILEGGISSLFHYVYKLLWHKGYLERLEESEIEALRHECDDLLDIKSTLQSFPNEVLVTIAERDFQNRIREAHQLHQYASPYSQLIQFENCDHNSALAANISSYITFLINL